MTAVRVDGTSVTLGEGDSLFQGDVIETGPGGALGVVFVDDTTFAMGEDARAVMDELVFDADTGAGTFNMSLVQGAFTFVSGQIAKSGLDAMAIRTPVATIGVRGTHPVFDVRAEGELNTMGMLPTPGGAPTGSILVRGFLPGDRGRVLDTPGQRLEVTSGFELIPPPDLLPVAQLQAEFQTVNTNLATFTPGLTGGGDDDSGGGGRSGGGQDGGGQDGDGAADGDGADNDTDGDDDPDQLAEGEPPPDGEPPRDCPPTVR